MLGNYRIESGRPEGCLLKFINSDFFGIGSEDLSKSLIRIIIKPKKEINFWFITFANKVIYHDTKFNFC
jgi:hypothetical protein